MVIDFSVSVEIAVSPEKPEKLRAGRPSDKRDVLVDHGHRRIQDWRPVEIVKSHHRHLPRNLDLAVAQGKENAFQKNRVRGVKGVRPLLDRQACQQGDDAAMSNLGAISPLHDFTVATDNFSASLAMGNHLAGLGYRRWCFVGHARNWNTREPRQKGFETAAANCGARVDGKDPVSGGKQSTKRTGIPPGRRAAPGSRHRTG